MMKAIEVQDLSMCRAVRGSAVCVDLANAERDAERLSRSSRETILAPVRDGAVFLRPTLRAGGDVADAQRQQRAAAAPIVPAGGWCVSLAAVAPRGRQARPWAL